MKLMSAVAALQSPRLVVNLTRFLSVAHSLFFLLGAAAAALQPPWRFVVNLTRFLSVAALQPAKGNTIKIVSSGTNYNNSENDEIYL